jgi:hypothetical protein
MQRPKDALSKAVDRASNGCDLGISRYAHHRGPHRESVAIPTLSRVPWQNCVATCLPFQVEHELQLTSYRNSGTRK